MNKLLDRERGSSAAGLGIAFPLCHAPMIGLD
jgi:hypothetical protein